VHGVDPAPRDALLHQHAQVGPELVPPLRADPATRHGRSEPGAEQHLVGVDEAAARHDRLVEQQREYRLRTAPDPGIGGIGIRVVPQRVGAEAAAQRRDLRRVQHLASRRPAQVEPVPVAQHPHPYLTERVRQGRHAVREPPVQSEVDVQRKARVEVVQQVLAHGLGADERAPGYQRRAGGEPALRAAHLDGVPGEELPVPGGEAVDGMSLWHGHQG